MVLDALTSALASIGENDSSGARGNAITAINNKATSVNQTLDEKITEAEQAKTDAVTAKGQAEDARDAALQAKKAAEDARDEAQGIVGTALTPNRVLVSNAEGKFSASDITTAILEYLSGLTGNVQTQLNGKLGKTEKAQSAGTADKWASARTLTIGGDGSGSVAIDGSGNVTLNLTVKRYNPPGTMIWYFGTLASIPEGYLICNGATYSRTTYAALFAAIGTKYGAGDGSTTFSVPDLSDGNGRFIRAGFTDDVIGSKQADAIRNITGRYTRGREDSELAFYAESETSNTVGAFYGYPSLTSGKTLPNSNSNYSGYLWLAFDASRVLSGHTNNNDIRPYNITMLPLIAY